MIVCPLCGEEANELVLACQDPVVFCCSDCKHDKFFTCGCGKSIPEEDTVKDEDSDSYCSEECMQETLQEIAEQREHERIEGHSSNFI